MLGGLFALAFGLGINLAIQLFVSNNRTNVAELLAKGGDSLAPLFNALFPANGFAVSALSKGEWTGALLFLLIVAAALAVFLLAARTLYFKGVTGIMDAASNRKAIGEESMARITQARGVLGTYLAKELRLLVRTPLYFLNCVVTNFLWGLMFLLFSITWSKQPELKAAIETFLSLKDAHSMTVFFGVAGAVGLFLGSFNAVTSTAISREGSNFYFMKYVPVSYRTQVGAKVLAGLLLSGLGAVVVYGMAALMLPIPLVPLLLSIPFCAAGIVLISYAGILVDLTRPVLVWDNEQKAVKQNLNVIILMGLAALIAVGLIAGASASPLGLYPTASIELVLLAAAAWGVWRWSIRYAPRAMKRLP
jgi:ABC-2 type transport system permease protein